MPGFGCLFQVLKEEIPVMTNSFACFSSAKVEKTTQKLEQNLGADHQIPSLTAEVA